MLDTSTRWGPWLQHLPPSDGRVRRRCLQRRRRPSRGRYRRPAKEAGLGRPDRIAGDRSRTKGHEYLAGSPPFRAAAGQGAQIAVRGPGAATAPTIWARCPCLCAPGRRPVDAPAVQWTLVNHRFVRATTRVDPRRDLIGRLGLVRRERGRLNLWQARQSSRAYETAHH